ncbi:hypothetical protein DK261_00055 [Pseudomonas sp. RW409]|nr:hypothetical protein DK261_00055 [Pseudomonas sp. RW409]
MIPGECASNQPAVCTWPSSWARKLAAAQNSSVSSSCSTRPSKTLPFSTTCILTSPSRRTLRALPTPTSPSWLVYCFAIVES